MARNNDESSPYFGLVLTHFYRGRIAFKGSAYICKKLQVNSCPGLVFFQQQNPPSAHLTIHHSIVEIAMDYIFYI